MQQRAAAWIQAPASLTEQMTEGIERPLAENVQPLWWLSLPGEAAKRYTLVFQLNEQRDILLAAHYTGPRQIGVTGIRLERLHLKTATSETLP